MNCPFWSCEKILILNIIGLNYFLIDWFANFPFQNPIVLSSKGLLLGRGPLKFSFKPCCVISKIIFYLCLKFLSQMTSLEHFIPFL